MRIFSWFITVFLMTFFLSFFFLCIAHCQNLPDAPSTNCGPSWAGGCYDSSKQLTWGQTFASKKWYPWTAAFIGSAAYDYAMTSTYVNEPCVEKNDNLGRNPTAGDFARDFAETHLPVIVIGTLIHKVGGKSKWASWIYPAMMTYGIQMHIRAGTSWINCH
jgi:hypothetical protein